MNDFELSITNVLPPMTIILVGILTARLKIYPPEQVQLLTTLVCCASIPIAMLFETGWIEFSRESITALIVYLVVFVVYALVSLLLFVKEPVFGLLLGLDNIAPLEGVLFTKHYQFIYQSIFLLFEPLFTRYVDQQQQQMSKIEQLRVTDDRLNSDEQPALLEQPEEQFMDNAPRKKKQMPLAFRAFVNCRFICGVVSLVVMVLPFKKPELPYCVTQSFNYLAKMSAPLGFICVGIGFYRILDQLKLGKVKNIIAVVLKQLLLAIVKQIVVPIICVVILKRVVSSNDAEEIAKVLAYGPGFGGFSYSVITGDKYLFEFGLSVLIGTLFCYLGFAMVGAVAKR